MNTMFKTSNRQWRRPVVWIYSEQMHHLSHVTKIFDKLGYETVHSITPLSRWDVMWAFEFPFTKDLSPLLKDLQKYQMVNHLPGSGFITLKVELATSKLKWTPRAFRIPGEKQALLKETQLNQKNLWVQKSKDHRGIKIVNVGGFNYSQEGSFAQLFVSNPLLIDGRKFDIGVYVVVTSVDPLRVYLYEEEVLVRFCQKNYNPFDKDDFAKYVVGADYDPLSKMPSLQSYYNHGQFSSKQALFGFLHSQGKDIEKAWRDIRQAVRETFIIKEKQLVENFSGYKSTHNFFELMRFDFVLDAHMNVWLMEANMSPNLSSAGHPENAMMYEQVIFHTLQITGIATLPFKMTSEENEDLIVQDRDIMVDSAQCRKIECLNSCQSKCELCVQCMSDDMKQHLKRAFIEHAHQGNYHRILPMPKVEDDSLKLHDLTPSGKNDKLLRKWFYKKCIDIPSWCN